MTFNDSIHGNPPIAQPLAASSAATHIPPSLPFPADPAPPFDPLEG